MQHPTAASSVRTNPVILREAKHLCSYGSV